MSGLQPRFQNKSAEQIAFDLYMRTGRRVSPDFIAELLETKFNPYHDPDDGRFTFKPGGGSLAPRNRNRAGNHGAAVSSAAHGGNGAGTHSGERRLDTVPDIVIGASRRASAEPSSSFDWGSFFGKREERPIPLEVVPKPPPSKPKTSSELGGLSAQYETSGRGVSTVSSGIGRNGVPDRGGVSYGSYQLTSQTPNRDKDGKLVIIRNGGSVASFLKTEGARWAREFAGLAPGSSDFSGVWRRIAQREGPLLHEAEHAYVKRENYDKAVHMIKGAIGVDFDRAPLAVRDVLWSTSVQHGAGGLKSVRGGATRIFVDAVARTDATTKRDASDYYEKLIDNIYARRTAYWPSDRPRYQVEMQDALRRLKGK